MKLFRNYKRGMTFIELIVVIGIFAVLTGIVLFNFTGFTTNISLQNLANQIALQIKKAQTEALSGTGGSVLFISPYRPSYGIYFDDSLQSQFDYFADKNNDGQRGDTFCSGIDECLDRITIQTGDKIVNLAVDSCNKSPFSIVFKRPFPDALFYDSNGAPISASNAGIGIRSSKNQYKTIIIWSTGQIEIRNDDTYFSNQSCN